MSEVFSYGASYVAGTFASEGTAGYFIAYAAVYAAEIYALNKVAESLGPSKPKGEGRGLDVAITDTGQAGFAIYGLVRVSGVNVIEGISCPRR
jgi:hypothetical protein